MLTIAVGGCALEMYRLSVRIQPRYKRTFLVVNLAMSIFCLYTFLFLTFPHTFSNHAPTRIPEWVLLFYLLLLILMRNSRLIRSALPVINVIYPFVGLLALMEMAYYRGSYDWRPLVLLLLCVWAADAFAYLVGSTIKGRKLAPVISPNKTISGWLGALIGVLIVAQTGYYWISGWSWVIGLVWIPLIWISATLGDLFESVIKRLANAKDSGFFLPGHGGFLDRLDSLIFSAPFAYFILIYFFS